MSLRQRIEATIPLWDDPSEWLMAVRFTALEDGVDPDLALRTALDILWTRPRPEAQPE